MCLEEVMAWPYEPGFYLLHAFARRKKSSVFFCATGHDMGHRKVASEFDTLRPDEQKKRVCSCSGPFAQM
jgi:hypothetical protein